MNELVSVIIPVYNVEQYLSRCIESVLHQTYDNFELILVDDGSTDKSSEICDHYSIKDKRVQVIHKDNNGANAARKTGVEAAKGEWIMFVDSDDTINSNCIESLYKHHNKADIIVGAINLNNQNIFSNQITGLVDKQKYIEALLLHETSIGPVAKLIHKDKIDLSLWHIDKDITNNEDLMMLIIISLNCDRIFIDNSTVCYNYLFRTGSASGNKTPLSMWIKLFSIIEESIKPLFTIMPKSFYIYCLRSLYFSQLSKGVYISSNEDYVRRIINECSKGELSSDDKAMLLILKSNALQKINNYVPHFYSLLRRIVC